MGIENKIDRDTKRDIDIMSDIWYMLRNQPREFRESYSNLFFYGLENGKDKYIISKEDYANCCYEKCLKA
mgnify:CR=1 FL=1